MRANKDRATSSEVLEALRNGPWPVGAYAWNYEVRNGTGFRKTTRYADAIVTSCYPSRGIWMAGVEVKVSRGDWRRELTNPEKAAEIQRFCDYWYIAAPPGVVELSEVPETWGLCIAPPEKGQKIIVKQAPKLTPEPLTLAFVASLMRNMSSAIESARTEGRSQGYTNATKSLGTERVDELEKKVREESLERGRAEQRLEFSQRDLAHLRSIVAGFERSAGLPEGTISRQSDSFGGHPIGPQFKAACLLAKLDHQRLGDEFRAVADALAHLERSAQETA